MAVQFQIPLDMILTENRNKLFCHKLQGGKLLSNNSHFSVRDEF